MQESELNNQATKTRCPGGGYTRKGSAGYNATQSIAHARIFWQKNLRVSRICHNNLMHNLRGFTSFNLQLIFQLLPELIHIL